MEAYNLFKRSSESDTPLALAEVQTAAQWLRSSGIQVSHGADRGAVHAWIDHSNDSKSYLYSEITGYFATLACHLALNTGETEWLTRARQAADWLITTALQENGAVLTRKYLVPSDSNHDLFCFNRRITVFFDCAMVGYGLLNVYKLTQDPRYLDSACSIGQFCLKHFISLETNQFRPLYDLSNEMHHPESDRWSLHWGSFNIKGAMFLSELAELTGDNAFARATEATLTNALQAQLQNGRFGTSKSLTNTHLHPHNYTIEGLLYLACKYNRPDLLVRARAAINFTFSYCLNPRRELSHAWPEGEFCLAAIRSDVLAQSLRCYYIAKILDPTFFWEWETHIPSLLNTIEGFGLPGGGTSYGRDTHGALLPHANAWCHFFKIDMLLYRNYQKKYRQRDSQNLIIC